MNISLAVEHNGVTYAGDIMRIKSTRFGTEDHGILTAMLHLERKGAGIGVGGWCLDIPVKDEDDHFVRREGTAYGLDHLTAIMETVGVTAWEMIPGHDVIVLYKGEAGWGGMSVGIASLDGTRVFVMEEHHEGWKALHPEAVSAC